MADLLPVAPATDNRLRIALAFPGCHRRGGVERILFECAHYLAARGHEVSVFAHEWDEVNVKDTPFKYQFVEARRRPDFLYGRNFFRQCTRQLKPHHFDAVGTFGCVAPVGGVPWVQSVHGAWIERSQKLRSPLSWSKWRQKLNPLHPVLLQLEKHHFAGRSSGGGRNYRRVIALTPEVSHDLQRIYGVPEKDIVLIPNGFAPAEFNLERRQKLREPMRQKLGLSTEDKVLIFVANEAERKGLEPLLQALQMLSDPQLKLLVVGRIPKEKWQATAEKLGLGEQVQFMGATGDVGEYYAAADLFVLPTQYEPWGLVVVEAMACGLPVLTSRLAGAAVAVRENESGALLDDPQDAPEIANKLRQLLVGQHAPGEVIAKSVQEYAWPRILQRYEKVLISSMLR